MLDALLHGKLSREIEGMEDVLTSCVFGSLRLMPPEAGILPLLKLARCLDGDSPFDEWPEWPAWSSTKVRYEFWPGLAETGCTPCEPDVLLTIEFPSGRPWLVLVEAKFRSGKSSLADENAPAPVDQLAREFDNLASVAARVGGNPVLIYLTADMGLPRHELIESAREYQSKYPNREPPVLAWLGWRMLHGLGPSPLLTDLCRLLKRLDLIDFQGLHFPDQCIWEWKFEDGGIARSSSATFRGLHWPEKADWAWTFIPQN